jgi:hypothetical protein
MLLLFFAKRKKSSAKERKHHMLPQAKEAAHAGHRVSPVRIRHYRAPPAILDARYILKLFNPSFRE